MANEHTAFWLALLNRDHDPDRRARLWNGYLGWKLPPAAKGEGDIAAGWPQLVVHPPSGGWPELSDEDTGDLDELANAYGGHPEFTHEYMDFSGHVFSGRTDFSQLILVHGTFDDAQFEDDVRFSGETRFYAQSWFRNVRFESTVFFDRTRFDAPACFGGSRFKGGATFIGVNFMGGASFTNATFESSVMFNDSRFEERYFSGGLTIQCLADFRSTTFLATASFREVLFGNDASTYSRRLWPERRADFSDAQFKASADFRGAVFGGVPAFFGTRLHEDTDFGRVNWDAAETEHISVDYAIRAWERLELMMSELEKPLDRHRFFRLKMRARRRVDGGFMRVANWFFETSADYGWGVTRAFFSWLIHWTVSGLILFANTSPEDAAIDQWKLCFAALGTGFSNAHAFLRLTATGGYLEHGRRLLEDNEVSNVLTMIVGTTEAVFGPIFLFLLLLTIRNRFRLA